ncbi:hypothetical protein [Thioclava pacifica]|uniref:Uncharacterized protein n=1 Tax=Thioclava pacifica DSM 10166 TaxID=1353537 RepID=A0A074JBY7_9RHOB|nr:hypothetical protein [Thioclava pacifica]KEO53083.1 hypothetical protein TP2_09080 [Thioclava pacifica DSM 10166]
MRRLILPALLALMPVFVSAQESTPKLPQAPAPAADPISTEIVAKGLGPVLAALKARPDPEPKERFAIAGLEFLSGIESTLRWQAQVGGARFLMPFLGNVPGGFTPKTEQLPPDAINRQSEDLLARMGNVTASLDGLAEGPEFGLAINLDDLWFDLNGDQMRQPGESAVPLLAGVFMPRAPSGSAEVTRIVQFDNADAAWLMAYAHMVSGSSELVLAFDPEPAIAKVLGTYARIKDARQKAMQDGGVDMPLAGPFDSFIDPFAALLDTLRHQPDPTRTRAARDHWLEMIAQNRIFWKLLDQESDNQAEWIPNDRQVQALGVDFPDGLGVVWLGVLDDGEALLTGKRTAPFWRAPIGIDIGAWFESPAPLDLTGVVQGWSLEPYFSDAPLVDPDNWARFVNLVGGRTGLMMFTLN